MKIISEEIKPVKYEMRDIIKKILQVLREDQNLDFGPRLQSSITSRKTLQEQINSKKQLLNKSKETYLELEQKLKQVKNSNDNLREELLESLGSEL